MAGLLSAQQRRPALAGADAAGPQEVAPEEESNVTQEEQAQYDQFVTNGLNMLYDERVLPKVLQRIRASGNPVEGLGSALAMLVMRLEDSAEKAGVQFSGDVKLHGAQEIMEGMVELAERAGIHEYSEKDMESALYLALDTYRTVRQQEGRLPMDQINADMQQLVQADQQGELDELLPGVSRRAQSGGGRERPLRNEPRREQRQRDRRQDRRREVRD